ncbi:aminoglycoside phosphotransferase family protein [soil metagenome]
MLNDAEISFVTLGGGVSSDIFLITDGTTKLIVKQALEKLKVKDDWYADTTRNRTEQTFLQYVKSFMPDSVPQMVYADKEHNFFAMEYLGNEFSNWKQNLLEGIFDKQITRKAAYCLAQLHMHALQDPKAADFFPDHKHFVSLRIEPYLITTSTRHPLLRSFFLNEATRLENRKITLIQGDFSPKNMMVSKDRLVLLDHEVACIGDPAFDVAFLLTHLLLKKLHHYKNLQTLPDLVPVFWEHYHTESDPEMLEISEPDTGRLLLLLLLARVDGKSPVEYLDEKQKTFIRTFVSDNIHTGKITLNSINHTWNEEIQKGFSQN